MFFLQVHTCFVCGTLLLILLIILRNMCSTIEKLNQLKMSDYKKYDPDSEHELSEYEGERVEEFFDVEEPPQTIEEAPKIAQDYVFLPIHSFNAFKNILYYFYFSFSSLASKHFQDKLKHMSDLSPLYSIPLDTVSRYVSQLRNMNPTSIEIKIATNIITALNLPTESVSYFDFNDVSIVFSEEPREYKIKFNTQSSEDSITFDLYSLTTFIGKNIYNLDASMVSPCFDVYIPNSNLNADTSPAESFMYLDTCFYFIKLIYTAGNEFCSVLADLLKFHTENNNYNCSIESIVKRINPKIFPIDLAQYVFCATYPQLECRTTLNALAQGGYEDNVQTQYSGSTQRPSLAQRTPTKKLRFSDENQSSNRYLPYTTTSRLS